MATSPLGGESRPVTLPGIIAPMPAVARILSRFDRPALESFLTVALELLEVMDGDPEAEESEPTESDGDDADGNGAEDEPCVWFAQLGSWPGCPIADPGELTDPLIRDYGIDQTVGPVGETKADQVRRWDALPDTPPLNRG